MELRRPTTAATAVSDLPRSPVSKDCDGKEIKTDGIFRVNSEEKEGPKAVTRRRKTLEMGRKWGWSSYLGAGIEGFFEVKGGGRRGGIVEVDLAEIDPAGTGRDVRGHLGYLRSVGRPKREGGPLRQNESSIVSALDGYKYFQLDSSQFTQTAVIKC